MATQNENDSRSYFETTDLGLAASLAASGFEIVEIVKDNPRRAVFLFISSPLLEQKVSEYWKHELMLPATTLMEQIKFLKSRIYG